MTVAAIVTCCGHAPTPSAPPNTTAVHSALDAPHRPASPLDPRRTALLVMDMQQAVIGMAGQTAQATLMHTAAAEGASRRAGVSVIFVATAFAPGYPEVSPHNKTFAGIPGTGRMLEGSPESRLDAHIAPAGDEPVIVKHEVGAFSAPALQNLLRTKNIDTLVLAGIATSGVVTSTAEAAADLDYRLIVLADCVTDADPEVNRILLNKVLPIEADVIDSTQYAKVLSR
ncbi:cysteine hydrolase family protein [Mycolicibacterium helvum]|uniref:Cysteine hydrolase n=1 Tax=Mycolicibacterium helvum TaxID=1534349 RepID=A0A7I7TBK6_9MYCO|nr:isochorismatase family cysteine hydrolase [Mycolicibacterium helvum]BBY65861.1 cysteine hydrolase [Mycolicibacterium helvum]